MDRNARKIRYVDPDVSSLSARRAWIEISKIMMLVFGLERSLSARRAWIEIPPVDTSSVNVSGRSPQGERG